MTKSLIEALLRSSPHTADCDFKVLKVGEPKAITESWESPSILAEFRRGPVPSLWKFTCPVKSKTIAGGRSCPIITR